MIQYLHEHGFPWDESTCHGAVCGGNMQILQYLHNHGCPWNKATLCNAAAYSGHLHILQYVREQGSSGTLKRLKQQSNMGTCIS